METPFPDKETVDQLWKCVEELRERRIRGLCPLCGGEIGPFKDELSIREFNISGMCQSCQDNVFESDEDE